MYFLLRRGKTQLGPSGKEDVVLSRQRLGWDFGARLDRDSDSYVRPRPLRMPAPNSVRNEFPKLILGSNVLSSHGRV